MTDHKIHNRLLDLTLWVRYKKELCANCEASCCYLPVEVDAEDLVKMEFYDPFFLELTDKEQIKEASHHPDILRYNSKTHKYTLKQRSNGACLYLDQNKKCIIYPKRPKTCANHPIIGPRAGYCAFIKKTRSS